MKTLLIFNHEPYDTTDATWNGLRLAGKLADAGSKVHIFLMNDAVDMAHDVPSASRTKGDLIGRHVRLKSQEK